MTPPVSLTLSQLDAVTLGLLQDAASGGDGVAIWETDETYAQGAVVVNTNQLYAAAFEHISGSTFSGDLAAGKWVPLGLGSVLPVRVPTPGLITALLSDGVLLVNVSSVPSMVTLPSAALLCHTLTIKAIGAGSSLITVDALDTQTIDTYGTSVTVGAIGSSAQFNSITVASDLSNYWLI
jgi:hypothetical protein